MEDCYNEKEGFVMNFEGKILWMNLKKALKWYVLLIALIMGNMIYFKVRPDGIELNSNDLLSLIILPKGNGSSNISLLYFYQLGLHIYFCYIFFMTELKEQFYYMVSRIDEKKWIIGKMIWLFVYLVIFLLFQYLVLYFFFHKYVNVKIIYFFKSFLYLYPCLLFILVAFYECIPIISYILLFLFVILGYIMNPFYLSILTGLMIIYLILNFKLKKMCQNFERNKNLVIIID